MEEAWTTRFGMDDSVHLQDFFAVPAAWANAGADEEMERASASCRRVVTGALELARADKTHRLQPGSRARAGGDGRCGQGAVRDSVDLAEIAITSGRDG